MSRYTEQERIEQRKPQFLDFVSHIPDVRFVEFVEVELPFRTTKAPEFIGRIYYMDSPDPDIVDWMKDILKSHHIQGDYIFTFVDYRHIPPTPFARITVGETYDWAEALYEQGRNLFFLSTDYQFYISIGPWEGYYKAEITTT